MRWCGHVPMKHFSGVIFESMTAFYQKAEQKQQLVFACVEGHSKIVRSSVSENSENDYTYLFLIHVYIPAHSKTAAVCGLMKCAEMGASSRCSTRPPTAILHRPHGQLYWYELIVAETWHEIWHKIIIQTITFIICNSLFICMILKTNTNMSIKCNLV